MSNSEKISAGKRAFGERVRQFRMDRERDWSQDDLAREAHLSQSEISKIEKANYSREPSEETIRKIARAFGVEPVDLARGTPFAALFAQSEVLSVGTSTEGPAVMAYFASALTNLSPEQSAEIVELDEKVEIICRQYNRHPLILYRPRTKTSPTDNPDVPAREVYDIDRARVASSDLVILAGIFPSLGAGMELQLALQSCTSVVLLIKEKQKLSRMVSGCPIRKRIVEYEHLNDLENRLPEALDALLPHVADFRFATSSSDKTNGLGDRIRQYREHRGLTEKDLARIVGVGTPYIEDLETMAEQVTNPSLLILRRLARALNLAEGFLITGHETPIQFQNRIFGDHLKALDLYSSEVGLPADDYKDLWKEHVDRYALELSIPGADRRVEIGDRKYWIAKHDALKRDNQKGLFARPTN